ncbi:IS3 family transposase [Acinetobacter baumannii]|nr:IS3 family transposase [Acinetobacter baumannii]
MTESFFHTLKVTWYMGAFFDSKRSECCLFDYISIYYNSSEDILQTAG